jgi:hypothetical protein
MYIRMYVCVKLLNILATTPFFFSSCDQCEKLTEQNAALMKQLVVMESEAIDMEQAGTNAKSSSVDAAIKVCYLK